MPLPKTNIGALTEGAKGAVTPQLSLQIYIFSWKHRFKHLFFNFTLHYSVTYVSIFSGAFLCLGRLGSM